MTLHSLLDQLKDERNHLRNKLSKIESQIERYETADRLRDAEARVATAANPLERMSYESIAQVAREKLNA